MAADFWASSHFREWQLPLSTARRFDDSNRLSETQIQAQKQTQTEEQLLVRRLKRRKVHEERTKGTENAGVAVSSGDSNTKDSCGGIERDDGREEQRASKISDSRAIRALIGHYFIWKAGLELGVMHHRAVGTACVFFRRFYTRVAVDVAAKEGFPPRLVAATCLWAASKAEECLVKARLVVDTVRRTVDRAFPHTDADLIACEWLLVEQLQFNLVVFHPYSQLSELVRCASFSSAQREAEAWWAVHDSFCTDALLLQPPHVVALGAILLVALTHADSEREPLAWIASLDGVALGDLWSVCDELIEYYAFRDAWNVEMLIAKMDELGLTAPGQQMHPAWSTSVSAVPSSAASNASIAARGAGGVVVNSTGSRVGPSNAMLANGTGSAMGANGSAVSLLPHPGGHGNGDANASAMNGFPTRQQRPAVSGLLEGGPPRALLAGGTAPARAIAGGRTTASNVTFVYGAQPGGVLHSVPVLLSERQHQQQR